jgi:small GTP-binding protein
MEESEGFSEILKGNFQLVVLIGASNVGKTALVYRYVLDELPPNFTSTIGVEFTKRIVFDKASGQKIQLHIWDTAGQERFKSITKHYYRGADACLLVYDISSPESFEELPNWHAEIRDNTSKECVVCLVGNKCDLETSGMRSISKEDAARFAEKHKMLYQETSALWPRESNSKKDRNQVGIEHIFNTVMQAAISRQKDEPVLNRSVKLNVPQMYSYSEQGACSC